VVDEKNRIESPFANRLRKVAPQRMRWAKRQGLTAFRVYDSDIPEYRYAVDWYAGRVHVVEYVQRHGRGAGRDQLQEVLQSIEQELGVAPEHVYHKAKAPKVWGQQQYEKLDTRNETFVVEEAGLRFQVNLGDYLDTGLFLDHRDTRIRVGREARGKRFLNLFCYTGAFTVHAAAGGAAATTSVDLSNTYLAWLEKNLELNDLAGPQHEIVRSTRCAAARGISRCSIRLRSRRRRRWSPPSTCSATTWISWTRPWRC